MGSTNKTTHYELSQFIGTDKPAWLQDYNGDMEKIDTAIYGAKTDADNAASAASDAQGDATTALTDIANINTEIGTIETSLSGALGSINTINSLIGNGEPTTTDKTIIGAINELHGDITPLVNTFVIEPLHDVSVYGDGVKTYSELFNELFSELKTAGQAVLNGSLMVVSQLTVQGMEVMESSVIRYFYAGDTTSNIGFTVTKNDSTKLFNYTATLTANSSAFSSFEVATDGTATYTDLGAVVAPNGSRIQAFYNIHKKLV